MDNAWIPVAKSQANFKERDQEIAINSSPPVVYNVSRLPSSLCEESIAQLEEHLADAKEGKISGLALVTLYRNGKYRLTLTGDTKTDGNTMSVAGMLAKLQSMALELF